MEGELAPILAPILALSAAIIFAWNTHTQRRALDDTDPATGAFLSVSATAVLCWVLSPFIVQWDWWSSPYVWLFAAIGLIFPAAGQWLQMRSVATVGPTLTSSLAGLTPLFAVTIGVIWLGDTVTAQAAFGIFLMIVGLVLAAWSPKGIKRGWALWAIFLPIGAALARGLAQPGLKFGFEHLPSPFFALLIGASVSTVVLGLTLLPRRARLNRRIGKGSSRFVLVGIVNGVGIFCLNAALNLGSLTVVSPLTSTTPLWTLALGVLFYKREVVGLRHLGVALLMVLGAVLVLTR